MIPVNKSTDGRGLKNLAPIPELGDGTEFLGQEFRLLDRYELQTELVETLQATENHRHLAPRVGRCHRSFRHWRCENNHDWAEAENSCSVRVCPHCSRRRSLILAGRMQTFLVGRTGLRYAVLAERNSENLKEGIKSLWAAWTRIRRSVKWKRKVKGCIVALEVTRNREANTWHPHLNVLMEGEYFPFEELRQAWFEATKGEGQTSFIRAADEGTVHELIKYVTKISDLVGDAPALDTFLGAVARSRLIRTYGTFYGLPIEDEENPGIECPDCKTHTMVRLGHVAPHQVSFDFEKEVFRVARSPGAAESDLYDATQFLSSITEPKSFRPASRVEREMERLRKTFAATSRIGAHQHGNSFTTPSASS